MPVLGPAPDVLPDTLTADFVGKRASLLWLALKTGLFTVLTLGIYRFWMKTRLRRWYWSAVRPGGLPLEYVGDPIEKLLGFLVAVVILSFYIGVVNLLLMFLSFSLFQGNFAGYALSFIGVVPLWFYARYRARRYMLARTRWRGLRFGLEPGAWGFAGRALMYWLLTIVSAGLLLPLMTYRLEKYKTDRTTFGTARMQQGGTWTMLYRAMRPLFLAVLLAAGAALAFVSNNWGAGAGMAILAGGIAVYGIVFYRVTSLAMLTRTKTLNGVTLDLQPSAGTVLGIYVLGYFLAGLAIILALVIVLFLVLNVAALSSAGAGSSLSISTDDLIELPPTALIIVSATGYFSVFLLWSSLTNAFVTMPVIRHYARSLQITHLDGLTDIRQRPRDEVPQAEGFAEALDVGASI